MPKRFAHAAALPFSLQAKAYVDAWQFFYLTDKVDGPAGSVVPASVGMNGIIVGVSPGVGVTPCKGAPGGQRALCG